MNSMLMTRMSIALLVGTATIAASASAQATNELPPELMEAIQTDIATIHQQLTQETIRLEPGQTAAFWAIYDEYTEEVRVLTGEVTQLLTDFAMSFDTLTDEQAIEMGHRVIELGQRRQALVAEYFDRIADDVGGMVAGQFLQIERRIQTIKDLRLEMEVPIVGR